MIVNFRDEQLVQLKYSEALTRTDFVATAGSLFSLFMGVSLLSVIEMLYYLLVRIHSADQSDQRTQVIQVEPFVSNNEQTDSSATDGTAELTFLP